jgi:hypothetical protein
MKAAISIRDGGCKRADGAIADASNRIFDELGTCPDPAWTARTRRILGRGER